MSQFLKTGVAYHGNRMPSHAREDMKEIVDADMDIVVHMFSHMDWDRHTYAIKDIIAMSEDMGLEVWVDNWGIGGRPGDVSHYLSLHPEDHMIYSNGDRDPYQICLHSPEYRKFVKNWLETVKSIGGKTIFWDEPHLVAKKVGEKTEYCCQCPRCKKLFEEKYNKPMPTEMTPEFAEFRTDSIVDFFGEITDYSKNLGFYNAACIMPGATHGISLESVGKMLSLPGIDNVGYDPYWYGVHPSAYEYVYNHSKEAIERADQYGKGHNIWIQGFAPGKVEEQIVEACTAAYDAGARTLLAWSFHGGESNNYRGPYTDRTWRKVIEGMRFVKDVDRQRVWEENRKKYFKG